MAHSEGSSVPQGAIEAPAIVYWASLGRTEAVRRLLSEKANPNAVDALGWSALQAAAENGHLEIVKLLVGAGANLNYSSKEGTALQGAIMAKQTAVIQYLRSVGAK
ncbi:ankyrin repeat domain-containing protein [Comamonas testosteroni]|uniref:Ankyrin repeat domain-containing protein n=1 Tax=Comamonas testosteroni TaxID=285 RepID=A0A373F131_COMTE|nr:ankyrin repeat domain-containing protein [Comamonas testosteroni]RGE37225.1 ankyrin repeat domain-containing protein [Comamonas testosteroni]